MITGNLVKAILSIVGIENCGCKATLFRRTKLFSKLNLLCQKHRNKYYNGQYTDRTSKRIK